MLTCRGVGNIVTDVNNHRDTEMLTCRRVGDIVTDVNNHRDTAMLTCRRVGNIVTDVNNRRDTAMLECRRVFRIPNQYCFEGECLWTWEHYDRSFEAHTCTTTQGVRLPICLLRDKCMNVYQKCTCMYVRMSVCRCTYYTGTTNTPTWTSHTCINPKGVLLYWGSCWTFTSD